MRKFVASVLRRLLTKIDLHQLTEKKEEIAEASEILQVIKPKESKVRKTRSLEIPALSRQERAARDLTEMIEVWFRDDVLSSKSTTVKTQLI